MAVIAPSLAGIALALSIVVSARWLRFHTDRGFYPTLLIAIASYYPLFAVMVGRDIAVELMIALAFGAIAVVGVQLWRWLIGAGLMLHGVFDLVHNTLLNSQGVPVWWPPFCASVDIILGLAVMHQTFFAKSPHQTDLT